MSLSPHKRLLPNFAEIAAADNNTIREDVENEQTERNEPEADPSRHVSSSRKSVGPASHELSQLRHIERIRNSYKKRKEHLEAKFSACNSSTSKSRKNQTMPGRHQSVCVQQDNQYEVSQDMLSDSLSPSKSVRNRALSNMHSTKLSQNEDLMVENIPVRTEAFDDILNTCQMLKIAAARQNGFAPKDLSEQLRSDKSRRHFSFQNTPGKDVQTPNLRSGGQSPCKSSAGKTSKVLPPAIINSEQQVAQPMIQNLVQGHFESAFEVDRRDSSMIGRDEFLSIMTEEVRQPPQSNGQRSPDKLLTEQTQVINMKQYAESSIASETAIDLQNQTIMSNTLAQVEAALPDMIHADKLADSPTPSPQKRKVGSPSKIANLMEHVRSVEHSLELTSKKCLSRRSAASRSPIKRQQIAEQPQAQVEVDDKAKEMPATPKDAITMNPSKLFTFNSQKQEHAPQMESEEPARVAEVSDRETHTGQGSVPLTTPENNNNVQQINQHERSTCKKPVVAYQSYIYGNGRKTGGLISQILNSGSVKDRRCVPNHLGSTHQPTKEQQTASKPQQSEYKQMVPRFEVTPDCQKQYQTGSFQPSQQSGGAKNDTKSDQTQQFRVPITRAPQPTQGGRPAPPRLSSIGRQSTTSDFDKITQSFSGVTIPSKLQQVQKKRPAKVVTVTKLEPSSPFSVRSTNARSIGKSRPSVATHRPGSKALGNQRDASPSALSSNTANARVYRTFDNNAPTKKSTSAVAGKNKSISGMNTSLRSKNPALTRKSLVPACATRQTSNNARNKTPGDLMESVREAASQAQRKLFNQAQSSVARKRQEARITQLYLGRSTDAAGCKTRGYLTGVRTTKPNQSFVQSGSTAAGRPAARRTDTSWSRKSAAPSSSMATGISDHVKLLKKNQAARCGRTHASSQIHNSSAMERFSAHQVRRPTEKRNKPFAGSLTACPSRSHLAGNRENLAKFVKSSSLKRFETLDNVVDDCLDAPQFIKSNGSVNSGRRDNTDEHQFERELDNEETISVTIPTSGQGMHSRRQDPSRRDNNKSVYKLTYGQPDVEFYEENNRNKEHERSVIVQQSVLRSPYRSPSPMNDAMSSASMNIARNNRELQASSSPAPAPLRAPQPTTHCVDGPTYDRNAKRSVERMKQYRTHLDRTSQPRASELQAPASGSRMSSTRASAAAAQRKGVKTNSVSLQNRRPTIKRPQELDVEECNRAYHAPSQLTIYQTALRTLDQRLGALVKGYRLRRALYNVREVREQMNRAVVQSKLWDEGLLCDFKELLTTRSELIEMVDFLQSGNLEWLRQGGHACVMSDKTFLSFEQECLYEKLRAELEHRNNQFNGMQQSPQRSTLVEESLNLFNQRALESTGTYQNTEPNVICHQNESQETFALNHYPNSHQVGAPQSRLSEEPLHSFYHDQKAIPISQIINDSIDARCKGMLPEPASSAFKFLSQEMPVPYTGQTTRSKKECNDFSRRTGAVLQDAAYNVGQGLIEQEHGDLAYPEQAGFVHSPPREQTTQELKARIHQVPLPAESDSALVKGRLIRPKRVTVDTSASSRIPAGNGLGLGATMKSATTPQVIQRASQSGRRDIYMSFDAQAVELGRPAILEHAYAGSPAKSSKSSKQWSPIKRDSPVKSQKKMIANKENPRSAHHNLPALNFKKLERRQEDIFQVPRLSAHTAIGGRRTRGQRSTQRSTNVTPKNGLTVKPQKRVRENKQEKEECEQMREEMRQQRASERRQVTVSDVLRLINLNKGTGRASDDAAELDVKALDKESKAQLRDAIGQLMRSLEDSPSHVNGY